MTAQVILHPSLRERLLGDAMDEIASCEADIDGLTEGTITPQQYGPEFDYYGAKEDAIEAAHIARGLAQARLEQLLADDGINGTAPGGAGMGEAR